MPRFFVSREQITDDLISVTGSDVNHIKNVLRMGKGDSLLICDGEGTDYKCEISELLKDQILLKILTSQPSKSELKQKFYLFQGLPKSDKMELIIQKATELGIFEIIPVKCARSIVKVDEKKEGKKIARWQQISESAAKQSGRGLIPKIHTPMPFNKAIEYSISSDLILIPYEKSLNIEETRKLISAARDKKSISIFIGPEGGFEEKEIEFAQNSGALAITLGSRILRTETAGISLLSALMLTCDDC